MSPWTMLAIAAGVLFGLWLEWELIRSAVRRAIVQAKTATDENDTDNRAAILCLALFLLVIVAIVIAAF